MRLSCPQSYSSPCLDLIFSFLEVQPKLSRNAVIDLNSARNPEQFWSIWGYLSHATCPVLTAQLRREVSVVPPVPHPAPLPRCPGMPVQGVHRDVLWCSPCSSIPPVLSQWDGEKSQGSRAGPSTNPLRAPHHRTPAALYLHTPAPTANKGRAQHIPNSQGCFSEWKYRSRETFPTVPCKKGCAVWQEWLVIGLWEQKCSFHSGLSNAWRLCRSVRSGYRWTHHFSKLAQQHGSNPQCMSTDLQISLKQPTWNDR